MNIQQVKDLIEIMQSAGLSKIELSDKDMQIKMEMQNAVPVMNVPDNKAVVTSKEFNLPVKNCGPAVDMNTFTLNSPLVGTVYLAPAKDQKTFVNVGDCVKKGDVICIVESMKMLNEIPAETDGIVEEIFVKNEEIVEFGQPMFLLKAN